MNEYQKLMTKLPPSTINNSRNIIRQAYEKAQKEGKYIGYWSRQFTELTGIEPVDEKNGYDAGNEPNKLQE